MHISVLSHFFERDLLKVESEIRDYENEQQIWAIEGNINNSTGTLCTHLTGNLNHFIGAVLGQTGYQRQREKEFTVRGVPRRELLEQLAETREMIKIVLGKLTKDDLSAPYPEKIPLEGLETGDFLIYLANHLNYHLGQINYHRRLTGKQ